MVISKSTQRLLLGLLIGASIASLIFYQWTPVHLQETTSPSTSPSTTSESTLTLTQKSAPDDPDLVISTKYVAEINGERVEVPVGAASVDESTAKVTTVVDVSPLVNAMVPNWEVGVGVGYSVDGDAYVPLSIQRNYTSDKAICVEFHFDPSDNMRVHGMEVQHKWMF